jgi:hypothetical protein
VEVFIISLLIPDLLSPENYLAMFKIYLINMFLNFERVRRKERANGRGER